ncbi:hypothetical protein EON65_18450 [archaeon]|nr:MAG: hypothetical protein EON65_18450 [archaeon]
MRTFADFLPSAKFWRFPAAFFIVSWVWQCANIIVSFHTILGTIALVLFGIALLCLTALLIVDSFPSSSRELLLGNTLVISITLSSALSVVLCASSRASLDGDGAYRFSCLCLISLATPVVLRKLIKSVNQYIVVGSMIIGVIAVAHSCFVQRSTSHAAHVAVCVLYTLCLSTFDDSGSNREQQPADETQSMPVGTQKDQGAPIIGLIANAAHDLKTVRENIT